MNLKFINLRGEDHERTKRPLRDIFKVCETGSFSKAAEALNYTQSGISQMMAGLEEELGVQLLPGLNGVSASPTTVPASSLTFRKWSTRKTSCARPPSISTIRLRGNCGSVVFQHHRSVDAGCGSFFRENYPKVDVEILTAIMMRSGTGSFTGRWIVDFILHRGG